MLNQSAICAFIATTDAAKAKAFYKDVLGLKFVSDDSFALVFDSGGIMLRVARVRELSPAQYTVLGWNVSDIAAAMKELSKRGVVFERYPGLPQDDAGVCTFPGGAKVAWFKDPDGNTLSLAQHPKKSNATAKTRSSASAGAKKRKNRVHKSRE
jgi:catechol 2,3-dioxygenase-like lactoylglutathione lyase family enzyme